MSNPNWVKGGPSPNPQGRGIAKAAKATGTDGVITYAGFLPSVERSPELTGTQKWTTYQNAVNESIVATGIRYFGNLLAGTSWHAEPNPEGGKNADRAVEIVTKGLLEADLPKPWPLIVRKAAMYRFWGFSIHATALRRRDDGLVVYSDIAHRPQYTIWRWDKPSLTDPLQGFWQRTNVSIDEFYLPMEQCFYCVDDTLTDSPEGGGLLRHIIELVRRLHRYQQLEAIAYEFDIAGLPVGRAPLQEIADKAGAGDATAIKSAVDDKTKNIRDVLGKRAKTPELQPWLLLDSDAYRNVQDGSISNIPKWAVEILSGNTAGKPEINTVIGRIQLEIARVLGVEFAMMGEGSSGSRAMHEDKTSMFASNLETTLAEVSSFATNQLARRLIRANGLDPDTCTPTLVAEPISTEAIETTTRSLANLALAGLMPDDPAIPVLRNRMHLPPPPERSIELMMPRPPKPPSAPTDGKATEQEAPTERGANDPGADQSGGQA